MSEIKKWNVANNFLLYKYRFRCNYEPLFKKKKDVIMNLWWLCREESERRKGVHHYKHAFRGFSAMLTEEEAAALSGIPYFIYKKIVFIG